MIKTSPKLRILKVSKQLFFENGFYHTGINQIIKEADTAKASFYDHFPSKDDLGIQVIRSYGRDILIWFRQILRKSKSPKQFVKIFTLAVRAQIHSNISYYQGCPVAVFSCQFPIGKQPFSGEFQMIAKNWEIIIERKLVQWKEEKLITKTVHPNLTAKRVINIYEGALINWRMSLDESYIDQMQEQIKDLLLQ
ncbi:MAG: TetR/AcrR family transcriptional regulator [Leptospira sp.]|nr:TetR/AcrR family transcriptional regulator [Leptospira sp.]